MLEAYAQDALAAGRYEFHMGHKLGNHLEQCGLKVLKTFTVDDQESSFAGPADPEVLDGRRNRFDRMMMLLLDFCRANQADIEQVRDEFLGCLRRDDHRSVARVHCWIATKPAGTSS